MRPRPRLCGPEGMCTMKMKTCLIVWVLGTVSLTAFAIDLGIGSHLAQRAARKVVGEAVQNGLEDAFRDAALSTTLDAVADHAATEFADRARDNHDYADFPDNTKPHDYSDVHKTGDIQDYLEMGAVAGDGVQAAMRAADVASKLDDVADAAKAVKKLGKLKKLKR